MKFYNRKKELALLKKASLLSTNVGGQFSILIGRRRIGKSELIREAFKTNPKTLYFFVSKKRSQNLLKEFGGYFNTVNKDNRTYVDWDELIKHLFQYSIKNKATLIFDEFQNFKFLNQAIFDIFQKYWDLYQKEKNLNIVVAGSLISLLEKLFYDSKQPLYKRATKRIVLNEFSIKTVFTILSDHRKKQPSLRELLYFYTIFGGNPYYYNQIYKADIFEKNILDIVEELILDKDSVLQNEGKEILIQEFGSEHTTYFAILEAIASNSTTFTSIQRFINASSSILVRSLRDLEIKFKLIKKIKPIYPNNQKISKYEISNNFIKFWFKYVYANQSLIASGKTKTVLRSIKRDLDTLAGKTFEKFCFELVLTDSDNGKFDFSIDKFGCWWDKTGEIDLLVASKQENKVMFGEAKLSQKKITFKQLDKMLATSNRIDAMKSRDKSYSFFCAENVSQAIKDSFMKKDVVVYDQKKFTNFLIRNFK